MARLRTQFGCTVKGCTKSAASREKCWTHYKQWDRRYGHLRCHWEGCRQHQDGGGRRMNGVFYCRLHEVNHLRITVEAETLNLHRLGLGLTGDENGCWRWTSTVNDGGYGAFVPEGANTAQWLSHRVSWDLLRGGHKPNLELDHRTCKRRNCVNPLHLEPVTRSINQKRKRQGPEWGWVNPDSQQDPRVEAFATRYGLPTSPLAPSPTATATTRRTSCKTNQNR